MQFATVNMEDFSVSCQKYMMRKIHAIVAGTLNIKKEQPHTFTQMTYCFINKIIHRSLRVGGFNCYLFITQVFKKFQSDNFQLFFCKLF